MWMNALCLKDEENLLMKLKVFLKLFRLKIFKPLSGLNFVFRIPGVL